MRRMLQGSLSGLVVLFFAAVPTFAQQKPPTTPQPSARSPIGINGFASFGTNWLSATEAIEAVGMSRSPSEFGGGAQVTNLWRSLFIQGSATKWNAEGERAFVDDAGNRFPLGIGLDVSATHYDFTAGWKFQLKNGRLAQRLRPYIGGGLGIVNYEEVSPYAQSGDDVQERATSSHVVGGLEVRLGKWVGVAGEVRYRHVPDLLGEGGVSEGFKENNIGGPSAAIRVAVGR